MVACHTSLSITALVVPLLLVTGSYAASSPFRASDKPVDKLVAAAQSVLQQAGKRTSATQDDESGLGRHKGDRFTSPVDGYFIQVRVALYTRFLWPHSSTTLAYYICRSVHREDCLDQVSTRTTELWWPGITSCQN